MFACRLLWNGPGPKAWENLLLSKVIQLWAQLLSNSSSTQSEMFLPQNNPRCTRAACWILIDSLVVKMNPGSSVCVSRLVERCEYTAGSVGMKVTGNGDFCQVFPVLLGDWDSQAEACLLLFSLGTKAVMLGCQSTWLLSLGTVPISLICLLFPSEGLCCNRRREGGIGKILPCFIDNITRDWADFIMRAIHVKERGERVFYGAGFGCSSAGALLDPLFYSVSSQSASDSTSWVTFCQEHNTGY